jgi:diguanylate cyclase (GGDEF)-like protein/PAS domain S-box-containing protein
MRADRIAWHPPLRGNAVQIPGVTTAQHLALLDRFAEDNVRGVVVTDARRADNPIVFVNRTFETITGYTSAEVVGKNCRFLQGGEDDQPGLSALRAALASGEGIKVLLRNRRKDGAPFFNELSLTPIRDDSGDLTHFLGSIEDVSAREAVKEELELEHSRTRALVESISDAFFSLDLHWRFTFVNGQAERLLGRQREQLLGFNVWDSFPGLSDSGFGRSYRHAAASGIQDVHMEYYAPLEKWFEARIYPADNGLTVLFQDVTEQQALESRLRYEAEHDHLTGLLNRAAFLTRVGQVITPVGGNGCAFCAITFFDLDEFKEVNDMLGHAAGDEVLQKVAQRLQVFFGSEHLLARMNGDEFAVLWRCADVQTACALTDDVLACIAQALRVSDIDLSLGASAGVACYPTAGETAEDLLRHAEAAMYEAKAAGKFTFRAYHGDIAARAVHKLTLLRELSTALERGEFHLVFQPQVSLPGRRVVGGEALIRWMHPTRGLVMPRDFIPIAEAFSHILRIGEWVIDAACRQLALWLPRLSPDFRLAVNISARHVMDPSLAASIKQCLEHYGVPGRHLELELTEASLAGDVVSVARSLNEVREIGVTVSVDDFGTGYSNLRYLHQFPISTLKVDRSFIEDLPENAASAKMIDAIIGIARSLGIKTLAEGVETSEQLAFIESLGCDLYQGYALSRPVSATDFEVFLG